MTDANGAAYGDGAAAAAGDGTSADAGSAPADVFARRPKRADARRNYEKLLSAAREAFAEAGVSASLEDIARRARVGIGTLYRHFPTRQDLFESVYVDEVEALCRAADELAGLPPWDALAGWLRRFVSYAATKRAIAEALNHDSPVFATCRKAIDAAGRPLLRRAQESGDARPDASFDDVLRLVGGVTMYPFADPAQLERVLTMALDGIRVRRPPG
ncbi:TetR/AcrR family transcriptional regulator [Jiangella aurantiaca]|uniref:TetR/AcrR family transcriptional regulator n=1 Tax=Jiangella aurantiaca TaxID=2530373 RepID=A0A4R4ZYT9_9ACTN|nr:TetR/AcrR family transcriptional regulator [Jiangella aurantiaca]TDD64588.1 TetR/AcrR family transcriptional regulator [Jiangella aurantiaca]